MEKYYRMKREPKKIIKWAHDKITTLRDQNRINEIIFNTRHFGVFVTEPETGILLQGNNKLAEMFGYDDISHLLQENENSFDISKRYVNPKDRTKILALIVKYGRFDNYIAPFRANDGSTKYIKFSAEFYPKFNLIVGVSEDITQSLILQRDLKTALKTSQEALDQSLRVHVAILNGREKETSKHSERTVELMIALTNSYIEKFSDSEEVKRLKSNPNYMEEVKRGALLHDIGKVQVPDEILLKPSQLDPQEWEIMRQHPQYANEILSIIGLNKIVREIPYFHHERWDGKGYPKKLKGKNIPLVARLFTIVDVYDALTSVRQYRPAWSQEATINYIKENSGKIFDPEIVTVFLEFIDVNSK